MITSGAEPFLLPGGSKGVLLIHGFTGSPSEMILLGNYLYRQGYTVLGVRLAGHGTTVEEMANTNWHEWYHSACDGYHLLRGICSEISVIGLSMGGLLAMRIGRDFPVKKIISMSAPVYISTTPTTCISYISANFLAKSSKYCTMHLYTYCALYSCKIEIAEAKRDLPSPESSPALNRSLQLHSILF